MLEHHERQRVFKNTIKGPKGLILAIIEQAYADARLFKNPRSYREIGPPIYRVNEFEYLSRCGRDFINANDRSFCIYCKALNADPEIIAKAFWTHIKRFDAA